MQAWIVGYRLGPPMPAKPNDERCVTRCHRECSFLPPEVQPPMLLPGSIAGFLVEQHAATKTAIPSIKLRRCTAAPKAQSLCGLCNDYSRDWRPTKWASGISLHGGNPEPLMSALGQKRRSEHVQSMSTLPPKRTLIGFAVRWRNVFDRNYVAFQALLDLCHSALWLVCRCLPCVFERYFGSPC